MHVIGFGGAGCKIAKLFEKHSQYDIHYIDVGIAGTNSYALPKATTTEQAENSIPKFTNLITKLTEKVTFICAGSGVTSGATLATLEQLKHLDINIVYVRPDLNFLSETAKLRQKVVYGVLQEYARSGLFKKISLFDNVAISKVLGDLSITEYFAKINDIIANSIHMLNFLKNGDSIMSNISEPRNINRISTIGLYDMREEEEKYFFEIKDVRQKNFYFAFNEKTLNEEKNLLNKISEQVKKAGQSEHTNVSYNITSTTYDVDFAYVEAYTNFVQEIA
tara:strand:+ start:534 stop:1367 length:834 start_codon:yes stop_codon:yes gene_type:complete